MAKRNVHLKSLIGPGVSSANQYVDVRPAYRFVDSTAVNWPDAVTYKFEAGELTINGLEDTFGSVQVVWVFQFRNLDSRNQLIGQAKTEQVDFTGTTGTTVEYTAMRQVDEFVPPDYMPAIFTQIVAARDAAQTAATNAADSAIAAAASVSASVPRPASGTAAGTVPTVQADGSILYAPQSAGVTTDVARAVKAGDTYWDDTFAAPATKDIPTVTVNASSGITSGVLVRETRIGGSTGDVDIANDPHFYFDGAPSVIDDAGSSGNFVRSPTLPAVTTSWYTQRVGFVMPYTDTVEIKVRALATTIGFRIWVNDKWVTLPLSLFTGMTIGNTYHIRLVFPVPRVRTIMWEHTGATMSFGGVVVGSGLTVTRPVIKSPFRVVFVGDSYTGGANIPPDGASRLETYAAFVAKLLGASSWWNLGIGGRGWVATTTPFQTSLQAAVDSKPDIVIVVGSRNDGSTYQQAVADAVSAGLATLSSVPLLFVSGPSTGGFVANNEAVRGAATAAGVPFLDAIEGVWLLNADLGTDGVHPTFASHQKLARYLYAAIRALLVSKVTAAATSTATSLALTATPATILAGDSVTLTATVTPTAAGTVAFKVGTTLLGTATVSGGVATLTQTFSATSTVVATFTPDSPAYAASTATTTITAATVYSRDDFTGSNGSAGGRVATSGQTWTDVPGVFQIASNQLTTSGFSPAAPGDYALDDGQGDGIFQVKFAGPLSVLHAFSFRLSADGTTGMMVFRDTSGVYTIRRRNAAGTFVVTRTITGVTAAVGDVVGIRANNTTLTPMINGVLLTSQAYTDSLYGNSRTRHGVYVHTTGASPIYDDWRHISS